MRITLLIIFIFVSSLTMAQNAKVFLVLNVQGKGFYIRDKYRIPLKMGTSLSTTDRIILDKKSNANLICNNYSIIKLVNKSADKQSIIPLNNYLDSCRNIQSNASSTYIRYMWKKLHEEDITINDKEFSNMQETGSVERGCSLRQNVVSVGQSLCWNAPRQDGKSGSGGGYQFATCGSTDICSERRAQANQLGSGGRPQGTRNPRR